MSAPPRSGLPHRGITALALVCLVWTGCALGDDVPPPVTVPEARCPTLDQSLTQTAALAESGALDPLAVVVRKLVSSQGGSRATALIRAVITILGEIGLSAIAEATSALEGAVLGDIEPLLARALRPFIAPPPGTPEAHDRLLVFGLVADAAQTCPTGSLTGTLLVIIQEPALVNALADTLRDPALHDFLQEFAGPDASPAQREALVTVLVTVFDALLAEDFQIDDLRGALALVLPADRAPYTTLLDEVARVFAGANLVTIQNGLGCIRNLEMADAQGRGIHGGRIIAQAIATILSPEGINAQELAGLLPADASQALATLEGALTTLQSSPQLRDDLIDLIQFVGTPSRIRPVLEGIVSLLDVGGLSEVIEAIAGILGARECDPAAALVAGALGADP